LLWALFAAVVVYALIASKDAGAGPDLSKLSGWIIRGVAGAALLWVAFRFGPVGFVIAGLGLSVWLARQAIGRRSSDSAQHGDAPRAPPTMNREEALRVLGLSEGVSREEIQSAHRNLIKKLHPDQGGSGFLAQQVNEAKDVLLSNH
jgi:hypothetical protein